MKTWTSYYLFYKEPQYDFLKNGVYPFLKKHKDLIDAYFFIRHWQLKGGFHVRLRLKTSQPDAMETALHHHFLKIIPADSIQRIAYQPESTRYGESQGLSVAERFFQISSKYVLEAMSAEKEWTQEIGLGTAIFMDTAILKALGSDQLKEKDFWHSFVEYWKYRISNYQPLEFMYDEQKDDLTEYLATIYEGLADNNLDGWQGEFYEELKPLKADFLKVEKPETDLLNSYIHMNNNRLGIYGMEEVYMAYMMYKSVND